MQKYEINSNSRIELIVIAMSYKATFYQNRIVTISSSLITI